MSKVDALRAMREAKYARNGAPPAAGPAPSKTSSKTPTRAPVARATSGPADVTAAAEDADELCGHRNMGGKSCSRPAGHSEKNHRYATA